MSVGISVTTSALLQTGCWRVSSFFWFTRSSHYWFHFLPVGASRSCCRGHPLKYQSWNLMIIGSILFLLGTILDTRHQRHKKHMEQNVGVGRIDIIMISSNFFNENHSPFQMCHFAEFYPRWQMSKGHMIKTCVQFTQGMNHLQTIEVPFRSWISKILNQVTIFSAEKIFKFKFLSNSKLNLHWKKIFQKIFHFTVLNNTLLFHCH